MISVKFILHSVCVLSYAKVYVKHNIFQENDSLTQQELCRSQARHLRSIELMRQAEAEEKKASAEKIWGQSGAQAIFGLSNDQLGFHQKAKPFNAKAAALGLEAQTLKKEAAAALSEADKNEKEITHLINHAMAMAIYCTELQQRIDSLKKKINDTVWELENERREQTALERQESLLREQEGIYCHQVLDLFDKAEQAKRIAAESEHEAARLESKIKRDHE